MAPAQRWQDAEELAGFVQEQQTGLIWASALNEGYGLPEGCVEKASEVPSELWD